MIKNTCSLIQFSLKHSNKVGKRFISTINAYKQYPINKLYTKSLQYNGYRYFSKKVVVVPKMGDSISEGTVHQLNKKVGDYVELDEVVAVMETDKVKVDIRSTEAGVITNLFAKEGETIPVGKDFFEVDLNAPKPAVKEEPKQETPKKQEQKAEAKPEAAPKQEASKPKAAEPKKAEASKGPTMKPVVFTGSRNERREPMSRLRLRVAQRLKESQNVNAMLTTFQEVDCGEMMESRNEFKDEFAKKHNIKLGFMSYFIKAAVASLKEQPIVNAVIAGNEIIYRDYIDISVAVSTPTGLLVPVLRNCELMNFADIEKALNDLSVKGRDGKITPEDMAGGTFTISNGGVFGSLFGTPILNPPQSAILGMHAIVNRPVVKGDQIVARPMMYLALTYDHRLLDGKDAVTFLKGIQTRVQDPRRLLLDI